MPPIVETKYGKLQGRTEDELQVFRGVPFAAPPVGELRFRAPRPPEAWEGVRPAEEAGAGSMQTFLPGLELLGAWEMPVDEDCLTLNIWTPALDGASRPVLFWIHGGGFSGGSGSTPIYDGQHLARRGDVVVVTINYRLGALGFLYNEALTDDADAASGNYGMRDQIAALHWVRDHISAFGGDPNNITIFGESAGGMSVGVLMGAPEAEGLFQRAIPQSGAAHHALPQETAEEVCRRYCAILEVSPDDAASLRSIPAEDMLAAQNALAAQPDTAALTGRYLMPFSPVVEGRFLQMLPIEEVRAGRSKDVDLLCGTIEDEWTLLAAIQQTHFADEATARGALSVITGDAATAGTLYDHYVDARTQRGAATDPMTIFDSVMTDYVFRLPSDHLLDAHSRAGGTGGTYAYLFNQQSPAMDGRLRAPHAIDIPFVWGTGDAMRPFIGEDPQTDQLTHFTMDAWLNFAKTGSPSTNALPGWPQYRPDQRYTMVLGPDVKTVREDRELERAVWSSDLLE